MVDARCRTRARLGGGSDTAPDRPPAPCPGRPAWAAGHAAARLGLSHPPGALACGTGRLAAEDHAEGRPVGMIRPLALADEAGFLPGPDGDDVVERRVREHRIPAAPDEMLGQRAPGIWSQPATLGAGKIGRAS